MSARIVTPVSESEVIALMDSIQRLWKDKKYSDLTIKCKGKSWKVHRSIICTQSRPLAVMIDGVWKEGQEGIINLHDDEPAIVEKMIEYCYRASYDDDRRIFAHRELSEDNSTLRQNSGALASSGIGSLEDVRDTHNEGGPISPLLTNAKVYILGDKYDIPALKKFAARMYRGVAESERHLHNFAGSVELVFENTPAKKDNLRDIIIETARGRLASLMVCRDFQGLMVRKPEIALEILRAVGRSESEKSDDLATGKCFNCGNHCFKCRTDPAKALGSQFALSDSILSRSITPRSTVQRLTGPRLTLPRSTLPGATVRGPTVPAPTLPALNLPAFASFNRLNSPQE